MGVCVNMSYMKNKILFFVTVVLLALFCVGCDNSVENGSGTGFVRFGEDDASRSLDIDDRLQCPVEDTYWAYTAVKVDGLHTTGESEKGGVEADTGINGTTAGGYKLRPVKNGPAAGLGVCSRKFAYGDWKFRIYGYEGYNGVSGAFTKLLYTSDEVYVRVNNSATPAEATFVLTETDAYKNMKSFLIFRDLYWTVPENMKIYKGSSLSVTVKEGTEVIARGMGTVSTAADSPSGTEIPVGLAFEYNSDGTVKNQFESGTEHIFTFEIKYVRGTSGTEDCDITETTTTVVREFTIPFFYDTVTTVYGSLDDVNVNCGNFVNGDFGYVVAITADSTNNKFADLQSAFDRNNTVTLVRDLDYAGTVVCKSAGSSAVRFELKVSNNQFIRNLTVTNNRPAGSGNLSFVFLLGGSTNGFYLNVPVGTTMKIKNNIRFDGNEIQIPKLGRVKVVVSRLMPESFSFTTVTISRVANQYYVTLTGEEDNPNAELFDTLEKLDVNKSIGLDFSLSHLYVDSDGNHADMPKYLQNDLEKLAKLTRKASKCQKGSKNSIKAWQKVRKEQLHISNSRKDFLHKESRKIANKYDYVFVENLDLKSMQSKDTKMKLGRNVSDRAYGTFVNFLDYKLRWLGKELIKVDRYFPSSKTCSDCGCVNNNLKLNDRDWICPICGKKHDRDINAAINIKKEGIRLVLQKQ